MDAPAARSATLISADLAPLALAQWWLTASGSLEPVSTAVAVDYLSHFFMISIMFHMTHVNFRVRMLGHGQIRRLSDCTALALLRPRRCPCRCRRSRFRLVPATDNRQGEGRSLE